MNTTWIRRATVLLVMYIIGMYGYIELFSIRLPEHLKGTALDFTTFITPDQLAMINRSNIMIVWYELIEVPIKCYVIFVLFSLKDAQLRQHILEKTKWNISKIVKYSVLYYFAASLVTVPFQLTQYVVLRNIGKLDNTIVEAISYFLYREFMPFITLFIFSLIIVALIKWAPKRWFIYVMLIDLAYLGYLVYPEFMIERPDNVPVFEAGETRTLVLDYAKEHNFPLKEIFTLEDVPEDDVNAKVQGNQQEIYIFLPEHIAKILTEDELLTLLSHEFGHIYDPFDSKLSLLLIFVVQSIVTFGVLGYLVQRFKLQHQPLALQVIPLYFVVMFLSNCIFGTFMNLNSLYFEYEADRYAVELMGDSEPIISLIQKTGAAGDTLQLPPGLTPIYSSHPTIYDRLEPWVKQ